jgi:hypothetical protein
MSAFQQVEGQAQIVLDLPVTGSANDRPTGTEGDDDDLS